MRICLSGKRLWRRRIVKFLQQHYNVEFVEKDWDVLIILAEPSCLIEDRYGSHFKIYPHHLRDALSPESRWFTPKDPFITWNLLWHENKLKLSLFKGYRYLASGNYFQMHNKKIAMEKKMAEAKNVLEQELAPIKEKIRVLQRETHIPEKKYQQTLESILNDKL